MKVLLALVFLKPLKKRMTKSRLRQFAGFSEALGRLALNGDRTCELPRLGVREETSSEIPR
jgi:hypothetical protein